MPPRSKQSKEDWVRCPLCSCTFGSRDQSRHTTLCTKDSPKCEPLDLSHGFITSTDTGQCLFSIAIQWDGNEGGDSGWKDGVVLLHPTTMRLLDMGIGDMAVLNHKQVLPVWPCHSMALTNASLSKPKSTQTASIEVGSKLRIQKLQLPHSYATHIIFSSIVPKYYLNSKEFHNYILKRYEGYFLCQGNDIKLTYFGQPCELTVLQIHGDTTQNKVNTNLGDDSVEVENVIHSMQALHVTSINTGSIQDVMPAFYKLSPNTSVTIECGSLQEISEVGSQTKELLKYVGGLDKQINEIKELMNLVFNPSSVTKQLGTSVPHGVLLFGPSGTGKSLLCRALAADCEAHVVEIRGSDVWSRYYGESESRLKFLFEEACSRSPSLLILDEIDTLCPRRETTHSEVEKRVVAAVLSLIDQMFKDGAAVMIIAATNRPDSVDPALRRPGRLDREIEISVPSAAQRKEILCSFLQRSSHSITHDEVSAVAEKAHGFVGADLVAIIKEAMLEALRRRGEDAVLTLNDVECGLQRVQPSAMREVALEIPQVKWSDIGGQADLKHKLRQAVEWPLQHPEAFKRLGIRAPRGLLMYGPPGCSKTMIAKALARESGLNFIAIKGPELFSKWVGESERAVREVFRKARAAAPAIVFFDEIDALAGERGSGSSGGGEVADRVLAQLLTEIDGVDALQDVTVVAATNRPDRIDKALLRPGRLDRVVYVPLPDCATRIEIFKIQLRQTPVAEDVHIDKLVSSTDGYSGAEVTAVCREAALCAMQEDINIHRVHSRHFDQALQLVTPRITKDLLNFYETYHSFSGLKAL